jgi:hypothetical protein
MVENIQMRCCDDTCIIFYVLALHFFNKMITICLRNNASIYVYSISLIADFELDSSACNKPPQIVTYLDKTTARLKKY